jgi:hypothetical protein
MNMMSYNALFIFRAMILSKCSHVKSLKFSAVVAAKTALATNHALFYRNSGTVPLAPHKRDHGAVQVNNVIERTHA